MYRYADYSCEKCPCQDDPNGYYLEEICAIERPKCGFTPCEYPLWVSFVQRYIIKIEFARVLLVTVIPNVPSYTEVTLKRHVGGGPLLSILRRSSVSDEESVSVDGSSGDRRGFGRIRGETRLARQTHLERTSRDSVEEKGRLFGDRHLGSHGRREESPPKYEYSITCVNCENF